MNIFTPIVTGVIALLLLKNPVLHAANFTWDGGSAATSNWSDGNNWNPNFAPPNDGTDDLIFAGSTGLNPNANLDWGIRSLTFGGGAGGFTIQGNTLTIGPGGIVNGDDSVQTILNDIVLAASQTFRTTSTGSVSINGNIATNGSTLTVDAATDFIVLAGAIGGSGALTSTGINTLVLTGGESNTYAGGTTVGGSLTLAKTGGATAIPGALVIGGGAGANHVGIGFDEQIANNSAVTINAGGSLGLGSGVVETIGALTVSSGVVRTDTGSLRVSSLAMAGGSISSTLAGRLILAGNVTSAAGSQPSTIGGKIDLAGGTRTFNVDGVAGSAPLEIPAAISNGSVIKTGGGTLRLSGTQSYSSLLAQAGSVNLETAVGTGTSSVTVAPIAGTATVNFNTGQQLASLTIGNGGVVNVNAQSSPSYNEYGSQFFPTDSLAAVAESAGGSSRAVPEPGATNFLLMSAPALLFLRRRKRR